MSLSCLLWGEDLYAWPELDAVQADLRVHTLERRDRDSEFPPC
jgi:hypothetical protein